MVWCRFVCVCVCECMCVCVCVCMFRTSRVYLELTIPTAGPWKNFSHALHSAQWPSNIRPIFTLISPVRIPARPRHCPLPVPCRPPWLSFSPSFHISHSPPSPRPRHSVNQYSATILKALFHLLCQNKFSQTLLPRIIKGYAMPVSVATLGMGLDSISLLESELWYSCFYYEREWVKY